MFEIGDVVEVVLKDSIYTPIWDGLVGEVEAVVGNYRLLRIRFPDFVPERPHSDPYILQLNPKRLRLVPKEPSWEV